MKKVAFILSAIFIMFLASSCGGDKAAILFNSQKITQDNVMNFTSEFSPNQRIYYLILIPKKVYTRTIEIQVIKKDNKEERFGYNLVWSRTAKLKDDQMYYYDDYVVIPQTGAYIMKVYSKDEPTKVLCDAQFFVRN